MHKPKKLSIQPLILINLYLYRNAFLYLHFLVLLFHQLFD